MSERPNYQAVAFALIPPEPLFSQCIERSANLAVLDSGIVLNRENAWPHLTVWMGVVDEQALETLKQLISAQKEMQLSVKEESVVPSGNPGKELIHLGFSHSEELLDLHRKVNIALKEGREVPLPEPSFFFLGKASLSTLTYVRNFSTHHADDQYRPHITLGYGNQTRTPETLGPVLFIPALFQLGEGCTCAMRIA